MVPPRTFYGILGVSVTEFSQFVIFPRRGFSPLLQLDEFLLAEKPCDFSVFSTLSLLTWMLPVLTPLFSLVYS